MDEPLRRTISLVREAQKGDRQAMEKLFSRYLPRVRQLVALRLGFRPSDFAAHEDIVQEVLLKTFKNLDRYEERSEATFRNWISKCVVNAVRDHLRRLGADKRRGGPARPVGAFESEDLSGIVFEGNQPTPSSIYGRKELVGRIEESLLDMKEHWREVILMRLLCEMSYREIGDAMGIREEATVRKLFSRAIDELRRRCA